MLKLNLPFETIFLQYLSVLLFKCDCIKVFLYNSDVFNENHKSENVFNSDANVRMQYCGCKYLAA